MSEIDQLREQIAAERSKLADAEILCAELQRNRNEIHQQLAAEREKVAELQDELGIARERYQSARRSSDMGWQRAENYKQQLAVAVEAIEWLNEFVIEPEYFPGEGDRQWWQEKRAALAKIGGK